MRVGLFVTCFNDTLFPASARAVVRVLERLGHDVVFPVTQTCCGQMHFNTGYQRECVPLVRKFVDDFAGIDHVVSPSASCVAMVREFHPRVAEIARDAGLARAVADTSPRVREFTEFLVDVLGVTDVGAAFPHRVTYHPTCHGLRTLGLADRPTRLLRAVRGLRLVDLPEAEQCCGFGGTFALKNADTSVAMGADKSRHVRETGAEVLAAVDNSCLMHVGGLLSRQRSGVRVMHVAEILASGEGP
ncbi:(Fe-S)-binding protein [Actinokineospora iranica]|uniref:L-lactate dehydrogenase complex protein LldE n=1 Tax=Actinokineospora iranica TaxID=1271860 RepID=A0A1G6X0L7_9PSEU|nr:(Fe-S)-binding protein [Actinokineospora iranica]SDD71722.1 L-lactate dehydrogenase complex protein LldE [Actinokineospora iranica]